MAFADWSPIDCSRLPADQRSAAAHRVLIHNQTGVLLCLFWFLEDGWAWELLGHDGIKKTVHHLGARPPLVVPLLRPEVIDSAERILKTWRPGFGLVIE